MSDNKKLVGIEIDWNVVRAVVLDQSTKSVIAYADKVNLGSIGRADAHFLNPSEAVKAVWDLLPIGGEEVRVSVSFAPAGSGVQQASPNEQSVSLASLQTEVGLQLVANNEPTHFSYACLDHVLDTVEAFQAIDVSIERVELSAQAILRVLPEQFTGSFTFASGAGWKTGALDGNVYETKMSPDVLSKRGVLVTPKGKEEHVLATSDSVVISEEFLKKYQLTVDSIWIAAGTALGLVEVSDGGNLLTEYVQERVAVAEKKISDTDTAVNYSDKPKQFGDPVGQLIQSIEEDPKKGPMSIILYALTIVVLIAVLVWIAFKMM